VWNALKDWVLVPVWNFLKWTANQGAKMVKEIAAFPPIKAGVDAISQKLKEFEDLFPDLVKNAESFGGMSLDDTPPMQQPAAAGATTSGSSYAPGAGKRATGAVTSTAAQAQVKKAGFEQKDFELYRDVVANIESKGKYDIQGGSGKAYAGRYQMGAAARQDAARLLGETYQGDSEEARRRFREDPEMQERYFAAYTRANHGYLMDGSPEYRSLSREGKLQVLGYAHNAGAGNAIKWLRSGMSESFRDGFGTRSDKYSTEIRAAQQGGRNPLADLPPTQRRPVGDLPPLPPSTAPGQQFGASRSGGARRHAGQDFDINGPNATFPSQIGGVVTHIGYDPNPYGYGHYADIYNEELNVTERIAEGAQLMVKKGDRVAPGQVVAKGETYTGVIHYEIRPGKATTFGYDTAIDPKEFLRNKKRVPVDSVSSSTSYERPRVQYVPVAVTPEMLERDAQKPVVVASSSGVNSTAANRNATLYGS
jgi:hypothetical protein